MYLCSKFHRYFIGYFIGMCSLLESIFFELEYTERRTAVFYGFGLMLYIHLAVGDFLVILCVFKAVESTLCLKAFITSHVSRLLTKWH